MLSTRQSARYKDELQTSRAPTSSIVKLKARKRYKVEMPVDASEIRVERICSIIGQLALRRRAEASADFPEDDLSMETT